MLNLPYETINYDIHTDKYTDNPIDHPSNNIHIEHEEIPNCDLVNNSGLIDKTHSINDILDLQYETINY